MAVKLTAIGTRALVKPGRYSDGGGLHLHVRAPDRRAWVFRYTRQSKTRDMGLGAFPEVSLAEARRAADAARAALREGRDPVAGRKISRAPAARQSRTFESVAEDHITTHEAGWRNAAHRAQWTSTLERHAYPAIGALAVEEVDVEAVLHVLRPIWIKTPETANRVRGRIEAVLDAAKARGWRTGENPARWKGNLAGLLPSPKRVAPVEHQPSLPWQQMGAFLAELRKLGGSGSRALELLILTAARTGEVRGARWNEIDLGAAVWVVPAERMKAHTLHRVPLSSPAVAVLRGLLPQKAANDGLVFPGSKADAPLSNMTLSAIVRRLNGDGDPAWRDVTGRAVVPHGFRSTFRVWAGEMTHYPREVVEAALAHTIRDKVEAAYARTDLLERRRPLMDEWATLCGGVAAVIGVD